MLQAFISQQLAKPTGLFGRLLTARWLEKNNVSMNALTLRSLQLAPPDQLLEIGFGSGYLIEEILRTRLCEHVTGVDFSTDMVSHACKRFRRYIEQARAHIQFADVSALPFPDERFSVLCSVNTIYFWPDIDKALSECRRVLAKNGRLVLCFNDEDDMRKWPGHVHGFTLYSVEQVKEIMAKAGFCDFQCVSEQDPAQGLFHCLSARAL